MTEEQKKQLKEYQDQLTYGRGISFQQWDELVELRRLDLIESGLDPKHWNLKSRNLVRKHPH